MSIYTAPSHETSMVLRHGSQFYLQTTPCLTLPRKHYQMVPPLIVVIDIQLQLTEGDRKQQSGSYQQ